MFAEEAPMTKEEMEKKLQRLEDIEAIRQMHTDYVYELSAMHFEKMLDFFAEDGTLELGPRAVKGKKAIFQVFQDVIARNLKLTDGHIVAQPVIAVDGDKAHGHWILYIFAPEPKVGWVQGRQEVDYVRVKGEWKFRNMKFIRPWPPLEATTH